jgi:hypothetical protein
MLLMTLATNAIREDQTDLLMTRNPGALFTTNCATCTKLGVRLMTIYTHSLSSD